MAQSSQSDIDKLVHQYDSIYFNQFDSFLNGQKLLQKIVNLSSQLKYKEGEIKGMYRIGRSIHLYSKNDLEAIKTLYKCLSLAEKLNNIEYVSKSYNYLGIIYHTNRNYREALNNFKKITKNKQNQNASILHLAYYLSGLCYYELNENRNALESFNQSLKLINPKIDAGRYNECQLGKARILIKENQDQKALPFIKKTLEFYSIEQVEEAKAICFNLLSKIKFKNSELDSALVFALLAKRSSEQTLVPRNQIEIYTQLQNIYSKQGNIAKAYEYLKLVQGLKDTIYQADISTQIELSQAHHDFDKEKHFLNEQLILQEKERKAAIKLATLFGVLVLGIGGLLFWVRKERKKSELLLQNILPEETIHELKIYGKALAKRHEMVTVMFCDVQQFSIIAEQLSPEILVEILDIYFTKFDDIILKYDIEKIKIIGDAYLCVSGLKADPDHAEKMVNAAFEFMEFIEKSSAQIKKKYNQDFQFRAGIHSGSVVSGVVGKHKYSYDIWGESVNIASRMESSGETGRINISESTYLLIKDQFKVIPRGKITVKNNQIYDMYFVEKDTTNIS